MAGCTPRAHSYTDLSDKIGERTGSGGAQSWMDGWSLLAAAGQFNKTIKCMTEAI